MVKSIYIKIPLLNSNWASYCQLVKLFFCTPVTNLSLAWAKVPNRLGELLRMLQAVPLSLSPLTVATIIRAFLLIEETEAPTLYLTQCLTTLHSSCQSLAPAGLHLTFDTVQGSIQGSGLRSPMWIQICSYMHKSLPLPTMNCWNQEWQRHDQAQLSTQENIFLRYYARHVEGEKGNRIYYHFSKFFSQFRQKNKPIPVKLLNTLQR